jgi:Rps23 Pro-64 3,4-dihydroxylase Tpa1-like proline 4-hydroxylase
MKLLRAGWTRPCNREPYCWLATAPGELLDAATAEALGESFPTTGFVRVRASAHGDKDYANYSRPLTSPGGELQACDDLSPVWRALLEDLRSLEYRQAVAGVLGQTTLADHVELRLVRHAAADFLGPHTDRPDKLFSHVVYFNRGWNDAWGGQLEVLDGEKAVVARIRPVLGASALIGRSEGSWHQVAPVRDGAADERRSLVVHGRCG